MSGVPAGTYVAGASALHRVPAGPKVAALMVLLALLALVRTPLGVAVGFAVVAVLTLVSRVGARRVLAQAWPLRWVLAVLAAVQVWSADVTAAAVVVGSIVVAVMLAGLLTLTTTTQALLDALVRGLRVLRPLGVDPERAGLVLALAIRAVPVVGGLARDVVEARRARGVERSVRAFAVPLVVRSVRYADRLGEALAARGVGD